jgi:hypothetical protein
MKKLIVMLALTAATIGGANPVQAKSGAAQARAGQAVTESVTVPPERARALHECNARIERFKSYYQMNTPTSIYRSCMHEHGEQE